LRTKLFRKKNISVARRISFTLLILLWLGCGAQAHAQSATTQKTTPAWGNTAEATIGQSAVRLYGPWKFTIGDSPIDPVTHRPLWAEPGFDDSKWETVDLTPKEGAIDPVGGFSSFVPGWTAKGHPGYWGYAWYRIRVRLNAQPGEKLALAGPADVDDAYVLFANGTRLGSFGDFSASRPTIYYSQPMMYSLPPAVANDSGAAPQGPPTVVLAFRFWMEPNTLLGAPDSGGIHSAPLIGEAGTVAAGYQAQWLELIRAYAFAPVELAVFLLLGLGAFSLTFFDRSDRVYMWMGAVLLLWASNTAITAVGAWTQFISGIACTVISDIFLIPLSYAGWVMVWWVWFGLRRPAWLPRTAMALAVLLALSNALGEDLFFTVISHPVSTAFHVVSLLVRLIFLAILLWIVAQGVRQKGIEGWLALPAVVLYVIARFTPELQLLHIQMIWFPFGVQLTLAHLAMLLLAVVLALLLVRRLLTSLRNQRRMALDVKQAQEVQQVILPQARTELPGFVIESEYRPALEVGGDFFQIIPRSEDGSLLIVAGDVVGKGLKAGMLVALLVGTIRTAAQYDADPHAVLSTLNKRLWGRGEAQATCLALRIDAKGEATLVNAGHLPPYLNGEPMAMEGTLPLGMMETAEFSVMRFKLAKGDRLVLMSDGIAEATDADGHLFGFERAKNLLRTAGSAAEVASAAQKFGQKDDISVISVTCTAGLEQAVA
jgi:serine phosphatase RsbU (regulator of sigma subunit)